MIRGVQSAWRMRWGVPAIAALACLCATVLAPAARGDAAGSQARSFQFGLLDLGTSNSCSVVADRSVRCWGDNGEGDLGNGEAPADSDDPVAVLGLGDVVSIAAASNTCAVRSTGTVACWGDNDNGQLGSGDGSGTDSPVPVPVVGLDDAVAVAAGGNFVCALRRSGTAACWGDNDEGQQGSGDGSGTDSSVPVAVSRLSGATSIAAGANHACALRVDATVACWGDNSDGQLGDGDAPNDSPAPVEVGGLAGSVAVAAGGRTTCVLQDDGRVLCVGDNNFGQLGDGDAPNDSPAPVAVSGLTDAIGIAMDNFHVCALRASGAVACWGANGVGQLGNGDAPGGSDVPVGVVGLTDAVAVAIGGLHSCALRSGGSVACWGHNEDGRLGDGNAPNGSDVPVPVPITSIGRVADVDVDLEATATELATGQTTTLTVTLTNTGPDAATGLSVAVPQPAGMRRVSDIPSRGAYNRIAGFWAPGTLAPGAGATLVLRLRATQAGTSTASAEVAAATTVDPDSAPGNADPLEDDFAQLDIVVGGQGAQLGRTPDVRLFVTPRRDEEPRFRFALTALVDLPPGVQLAACTGSITFGFLFGPLDRLRAIRTRTVVRRGGLCGFRFAVTIPAGLERAIAGSGRVLGLRSLALYGGSAQLARRLSKGVLYGAG